MISCVAFDFDGTLVDSNRLKRETFFDVVAAFGGSASAMHAILASQPGDRFEIFREFVRASPPLTSVRWDDATQVLCAEYTRRCEDAIANCPSISGAERLLAELQRRGLMLALISATPAEPLDAVVVRRGWRSAFTHVVGGASDKAAALRRLALVTGLSANEIVMVGDRQIDKTGAEDFGCRFVAVFAADNDFTTPPQLGLTDLMELPSLLGLEDFHA